MRRSIALSLLTLSFVCACSDKQAPPPEMPQPPKQTAATANAEADNKGSRIRRAHLDAVLNQGPPWLLQRVPVEDVTEKGKFLGWRVLELPADWEGIELRPGDIVTKVNAMPLERPDDFWAAWTTLSVASEVRIAYSREGEAREMRIPIEGSPNPALSKRLQDRSKAPPTRKPSRPRQKKTVVIKSKERPLSDTLVDWSQ